MFGIMQNYLEFSEFLHMYECVLLPTNSNFFSPFIKYAIIDHTSVALMCTDGFIRSQICISCHCGGRQICSCFAAR